MVNVMKKKKINYFNIEIFWTETSSLFNNFHLFF